ncbi:hypothetical protein FACS189451_09890 [Bacteroidia bacterium]|nr:hypothetical protein FACS189451_09890 [Bacteroidia bacterium]
MFWYVGVDRKKFGNVDGRVIFCNIPVERGTETASLFADLFAQQSAKFNIRFIKYFLRPFYLQIIIFFFSCYYIG